MTIFALKYLKLTHNRSHNQGDRKRAISSIAVGAMIWDNFSIFRTVRAPAAHARTCCEDFCRCCAAEMTSEIP